MAKHNEIIAEIALNTNSLFLVPCSFFDRKISNRQRISIITGIHTRIFIAIIILFPSFAIYATQVLEGFANTVCIWYV